MSAVAGRFVQETTIQSAPITAKALGPAIDSGLKPAGKVVLNPSVTLAPGSKVESRSEATTSAE